MFLFYALIAISIILYAVCTKFLNGKKAYLLIMFIIIAILMMFKGPTVGNDTDVYINLYKTIGNAPSIKQFIIGSRFEPGFILLCSVLNQISSNPQILFMVTGFVMSISFYCFIKNYSADVQLSILMFLTLQFFDSSMSGIRQMLGVAILLFSYRMAIERKPIKFILIVLLATVFHTSSIFFIILYPLITLKNTRKLYFVTSVAGVGMFFLFNYFISVLAYIFPQYVKYLTSDGISFSVGTKLATVIIFALWFILFLIGQVCKNNGKKSVCQVDENSLLQDRIIEISSWLGVICLLLSTRATILGRFKYIFSFSMIVYYPNMINRIYRPKNKMLVRFVSIVVFVAYAIIIYTFRPEWQSTYPYVFCSF